MKQEKKISIPQRGGFLWFRSAHDSCSRSANFPSTSNWTEHPGWLTAVESSMVANTTTQPGMLEERMERKCSEIDAVTHWEVFWSLYSCRLVYFAAVITTTSTITIIITPSPPSHHHSIHNHQSLSSSSPPPHHHHHDLHHHRHTITIIIISPSPPPPHHHHHLHH